MADVATPSGAAMFDAGKTDKKADHVKPTPPDLAAFEASLKKAEREHADSVVKLNAIKAKLDVAKPVAKDSPSAKHRADLLSQLKEIREKQGAGKSGRNKVFEQIKAEDEKLKELISKQKADRSRVSFKSAEDVDREIDRLDQQVSGGMMKLVDEKKALEEISKLRKTRKQFGAFDDVQKQIDERKAKLKSLRDSLEDPESKALSEKYNQLQAELDAIKAEQDDAYKSINSLRDERKKLQDEQQAKWLAMKQLKDDYYQAGRAVQKYEYEARQRARERKKAENEKYHQEKKKERAQQMLTEASDKAYLDEIRRAESLLRFLDPSYTSEKAPLQAPSKFTAQASRTVDDSGIQGVKVVKKDEEDYFAGTGGKKGKKNKANKKAESPAAAAKYSCPPSVMEDCASMGIDPPMAAADIEAVRAKVQEKLDFWKKDQATQTEKNIAKAKKELERLEAEEASASGPGTPTTTTVHSNGEHKATAGIEEGGSVANEINLIKSAVADVAADLKGASIEDEE